MITSVEQALVVDDDSLMRDFVVETLSRRGLHITQAQNGQEAKRLLEEREFDIAFIDMKMPGMDGMQLLRAMKEMGVTTLPVMVTAFGTVERAVEAMKMGAYDFLMKPFSPEQVELVLDRASEWIGMRAQNAYLREELGWQLPRGRQMVGRSPAMQKMMAQIERVARASATVLVTGESGTGKELVALAIHSLSDRRDRPFIRMSCAAVPSTLMDSELFGHEKGAFTSAVSRRLGRFELADGGTLLLDEIGELELGLQAKLLRVLQEREFERVGGTRTIRTDCRVIASTNRNLAECVKNGTFREDLFYRLNVLPLHSPPLRERAEDIPLLARHFLEQYGGHRERVAGFTPEALALLCAYTWPGNIRELGNVIERLSVLAPEGPVGCEELPPEIRGTAPIAAARPHNLPPPPAAPVAVALHVQEPAAPAPAAAPLTAPQAAPPEPSATPLLRLADMEREAILRALQQTSGARQQAADLLGISVRTLRNKLNQYRADGSCNLDDLADDGMRVA
jgi:DNA-binding NtrC family response regulator